MSLQVELRHRQGEFELDLAFTAGTGVTALFGPSGAGKTSVVRLIAGLLRPQHARVVFDDTLLVDTARNLFVPAHRRRIGYVFQDARLFPHLSVRHNLTFGGWFAPRGVPGPTFDDVVALLGLESLLPRMPAALSGGERQRVAIGRALLARPRLLLMDEPLASIDAARRAEILPYLERLRDTLRLPIVYVSHALAEVSRLAEHVVMLDAGRVRAQGHPVETLMHARDAPPILDAEPGSLLEAVVDAHDDEMALTRLACAGGHFFVPRLLQPTGTRVRLWVRSRDVMVALEPPHRSSALNVVAARLDAIREVDATRIALRLNCSNAVLWASITRLSCRRLALRPGMPLHAVVKSVSFDPHMLPHAARRAD